MPPVSNDQASAAKGLQTIQLALQSAAVFDIPPRTRRVILVGGVIGVVLITAASLVSGEASHIQVDKIIHFTGYATLSCVFVLALGPVLYIPGLVALVALGFGIEYLQGFTTREVDIWDGVANTIGVFLGATVGLTARGVYSYIRRELILSDVRRNTSSWNAGETILEQGAESRRIYVVKGGMVRLSREEDGNRTDLGLLGPGDVFGVLATLERRPQQASAVAVVPSTVFAMEVDDLVDGEQASDRPALTVIRALSRRLREATEKLERASGRSPGTSF
jgi:VanZ family protein